MVYASLMMLYIMEYTIEDILYKYNLNLYTSPVLCFVHFKKAVRVPSQVTGLSLSKAVSSRFPALRATWATPQSDEPISKYILQYRIHGTTSWGSEHIISGSPPQTSTIVSRLSAGTEYNVRVRAESAVGVGNWSAVQTERTYMSEFFVMMDNVQVLQGSCTYGAKFCDMS